MQIRAVSASHLPELKEEFENLHQMAVSATGVTHG